MRAIAIAFLALAAVAVTGCAEAPPPPPVVPVALPRKFNRDKLLRIANELVLDRKGAQARRIYAAMLLRNPKDAEVQTALARLDAWSGDFVAAERGYRTVLDRFPGDDDVRAQLVDILLWQRRWAEATKEIDAALAVHPRSVPILERKARLANWQGDEPRARKILLSAEKFGLLSSESKLQKDRAWMGEARFGLRLDIYPPGYQSLLYASLTLTQKWRNFIFTWDQLYAERYGTVGQPPQGDLIRTLGLTDRFKNGAAAGFELGWGRPGHAAPVFLAHVHATFPLTEAMYGSISYRFWVYTEQRYVHIVSPTLFYTISQQLEVSARAFVTYVQATAQPVGATSPTEIGATSASVALRAAWYSGATFSTGIEYAYGSEMDRNPALLQLLDFHSHIVSVYADRYFVPNYGIRVGYSFDYRMGPHDGGNVINAFEVRPYIRW